MLSEAPTRVLSGYGLTAHDDATVAVYKRVFEARSAPVHFEATVYNQSRNCKPLYRNEICIHVEAGWLYRHIWKSVYRFTTLRPKSVQSCDGSKNNNGLKIQDDISELKFPQYSFYGLQ